MITINNEIARRFILGKQGLWPGRRWQGDQGTDQAMRATEYLQLDPLQIIARSHDLQLHSRVLDYSPGLWADVAYTQRQFFDWGGWLATRPMEELPYWRTVMHRERDGHPDCDPRVRKMARDHTEVIAEMRRLLSAQDTATNRDFDMALRERVQSYRGRKDSSLALYYLWRIGEVMIHHRENFERVYALAETVAPHHLFHEIDPDEVDRFLFKKEISFSGISRLKRTGDAYFRGVPFSKKKEVVAELLANGDIIEVRVEGWKPVQYALAGDAAILEELSAGRVPETWQPLETNTTEEALFLAPLDPVIARGRAKELFGFDYVWEVYKPQEKRQYGYYTLPVLWGDRLVARFDSKLDRPTNTLIILGFWLEDESLAQNEPFTAALSRAFTRFLTFLDAINLDANKIPESLML